MHHESTDLFRADLELDQTVVTAGELGLTCVPVRNKILISDFVVCGARVVLRPTLLAESCHIKVRVA